MESLIDYSRQREFDSTFSQELNGWNHAIIGCGGVGFWLGIILAMQGYNNFTLFDGQILEKTNMNRIPVPPNWLGTKKVVALRKLLKQLRPETNVINFPNHITEENLDVLGQMITRGGLNFIIWDCTDDARIQRKVYDWSKSNRIRYRKIGYEGFTAGSYKNYDVWTAPDYQPGYRTSNACASSSAFAAVMGFMAQGLGLEGDVNLDIRTILAESQKPLEKRASKQMPPNYEEENLAVRSGREPGQRFNIDFNNIPRPGEPILIDEGTRGDNVTLTEMHRRFVLEESRRNLERMARERAIATINAQVTVPWLTQPTEI